MDPKTVSCYFVGYAEKSKGYKLYDLERRTLFETGNATFFEDMKLGDGDKENKNLFFYEEEECQKSGSQSEMVLISPIAVGVAKNMKNIDSTANHDLIPESQQEQVIQPQEQFPEEPQESLPLRRSTREKKNAIPDDFVVFIHEHEDGIELINDNPLSIYQALQSANSDK